MFFPLIDPGKDPVVGPDSHTSPVRIVKWVILVGVRKGEAICDRLFSGCHISLLSSYIIVKFFPNRNFQMIGNL